MLLDRIMFLDLLDSVIGDELIDEEISAIERNYEQREKLSYNKSDSILLPHRVQSPRKECPVDSEKVKIAMSLREAQSRGCKFTSTLLELDSLRHI